VQTEIDLVAVHRVEEGAQVVDARGDAPDAHRGVHCGQPAGEAAVEMRFPLERRLRQVDMGQQHADTLGVDDGGGGMERRGTLVEVGCVGRAHGQFSRGSGQMQEAQAVTSRSR
jgi:hypothetical protein